MLRVIMKDSYQDINNQEPLNSELENSEDTQHKREVKKRLEDILEQKRLRKSIGMDDTHNYWDEL